MIMTRRSFLGLSSTVRKRCMSTACMASSTQPVRSGPVGYINITQPVPYDVGLQLQNTLVRRRHRLTDELKNGTLIEKNLDASNPLDIILFLQHTPTFTAGRRIRGEVEEGKRLNALGAEYVETMRGGQVTFHGPGQLVAYPIMDIRDYKLTVRCYVSRLEKTIIDACKTFGVDANTTENTGVWVGQDDKIAALGVHLQRYVSSHGLALNCDVNLDWYKQITPCGLPEKKVTSLSEQLDRQVSVSETVPIMIHSFEKLFGKQLVPARLDEVDSLIGEYL